MLHPNLILSHSAQSNQRLLHPRLLPVARHPHLTLSLQPLNSIIDCRIRLLTVARAPVPQLPKLQQAFEDTVNTIVAQLQSIQVLATGAPVILVGTRKDEVRGGTAALADLSERLLDAVQKRCGPAVEGLERDTESGLCFFAIENSKGFKGDATIRQLVQAIERTARKQPSMKLTLPAAWLRVLDALKKRKERCVLLEEVRSVAQRHGLPSADVPLEEELAVMLTFFHSRKAASSK